MSATTPSTQRVRCIKATSADFSALMAQLTDDPPGPGPDENTLYFVNENGSFSPQAMDEDGHIYLGPKLLTPRPPEVFAAGSDAAPGTPGRDGLVPAPTYNERLKYLRGDGSWQTPPQAPGMAGATDQAPGSPGLVPQPAAGDNEKFLRGDGSWAWPAPIYGTCLTSASTVAKTATVSGPFTLAVGAVIFVRFSYANTATAPTLNVNGTGARPIKRYGSTNAGNNVYESWNAGSVQCLVYDANNNWILLGWLNTLYSTATQSQRGLMSAADKIKLDGLPATLPAATQLVGHVQNKSFVSELSPYYQDESDMALSSTGMYIDDDHYQQGDWIELTAHLTCGNTATANRTVVFAIEKYRRENEYDDITYLASAMVTLQAPEQGKTTMEQASLTALYQVQDSDLSHEYMLRIHVFETDNRPVRLYSSVPCGSVYIPKASTYTLKAWRTLQP